MHRADQRAGARIGALQARLDAAVADAPGTRTVVALARNGERRIAANGGRADRPEDESFRTGCVTKLLVAALIGRKLAGHRLDLRAEIGPLLRVPGTDGLAGITLRQLLEHTHGLDDGLVGAVPRDARGRIDVERLLVLVGEGRLAAPGALYSYSNAGAWLLAAMLEALEGQSFAVQLADDLFAPLGIGMRGATRKLPHCPPGAVCPAMGGGLALTVGDLLAFLEASAAQPAIAPIGADRDGERITPLPGWHPLERGVRLGWKCYDDGWLGHQSVLPCASLLVRVRPQDRSAVVVASSGYHAAVVAAKVLGPEIPSLVTVALPRARAGPAPLDTSAYCGRYASAAESLEVETLGGGLMLGSANGRTRLVGRGNHLFLLERPEPGRAFVEFIDSDGGRFRRLWDGRRVYPLERCS
jgi:CubicO group peptidase (beta-lactamase class C family)